MAEDTEDEKFLQNLIKPVVPKTKEELLRGASGMKTEQERQSSAMSSVRKGGLGGTSVKSTLKKQP